LTNRERFFQQRVNSHSVFFFFTSFTGCHEKSTDRHETDHHGDSGNCKSDNCSYQNSGSPLPETAAVPAAAADTTSAFDGDWRTAVATTDFADLAPATGGGDTSIRCVVQPPPDMLATRVCVEVGLVKSPAAASEQPDETPTIVVCSVDVEPCRKPEAAGKRLASTTPERVDGGDADVLDRISQDLDYLLNRKCADAAADRGRVQRNRQKKQKPLKSLNDAPTQRRTRL